MKVNIAKNLLIIRDNFEIERFFGVNQKKDWEVLSLREFLKQYKQLIFSRFNSVVIGVYSIDDRSLRFFLSFFIFLIGAKKRYFIDNNSSIKNINFWNFLFIEFPLFLGESIFNSLVVIISWFGLIIFYFLPKKKKSNNKDVKNIVYLRTDNFRELQQGGSFTHFRGVISGFYKLGYKINYIGSGKIEVPNLNFSQNIINYPKKFNFPEIPEIYYNWRFIPRAYQIIKTEKPLFIYQRHSIFNCCGAILSQITGVPLVLEYNGSEPWVRQKWGGLLFFKHLCYFFENVCLKKADLISVVSKPIKDELLKKGIADHKILVNYNGVDIEEFNPQIDGSDIRKKYHLENKIVIGSLSTFGIWHGMSLLSQAVQLVVKQLEKTKYKIHFLFIGDGVQRLESESIIQESQMEDNVTFSGTISFVEVKKYLAACDILVASHIPNPDGTSFFGSPTKLFEYMAMGKGIVASNLDQIGEVLEHQKTAWLVKPGDLNDLAKGITELIKNENLRQELSKSAREEVSQKYTWEKNVTKILNYFMEL